MRTLSSLVRPNILKLTPYSSARSEFTGEGEIFLDANENPFGTHNRYPDPLQKELKQLISANKNINTSNIFIGNGSDEVIDLCFRIFCMSGIDKALTITPSYGMYDVSAAINDIELIKIPLTKTFQPNIEQLLNYTDNETIKLLILCSPNNPTGNILEGIEKVIEKFKGIVLIDEAYIDFATTTSFTERLNQYPNIIVSQTLSKAYGLAAARIGIAYASKEIISLLNSVKPPYNVSTLNQRAAIDVLKNTSVVERQRELLVAERKRVIDTIENEQLLAATYPSDTNFFLAEANDADELYQYLLSKGIIIRNRSRQIKNCIRITIGMPTENNVLLTALRNYKNNAK